MFHLGLFRPFPRSIAGLTNTTISPYQWHVWCVRDPCNGRTRFHSLTDQASSFKFAEAMPERTTPTCHQRETLGLRHFGRGYRSRAELCLDPDTVLSPRPQFLDSLFDGHEDPLHADRVNQARASSLSLRPTI